MNITDKRGDKFGLINKHQKIKVPHKTRNKTPACRPEDLEKLLGTADQGTELYDGPPLEHRYKTPGYRTSLTTNLTNKSVDTSINWLLLTGTLSDCLIYLSQFRGIIIHWWWSTSAQLVQYKMCKCCDGPGQQKNPERFVAYIVKLYYKTSSLFHSCDDLDPIM